MAKTLNSGPVPARSRLKVVLINTRNPLNIGAVARAMSNFGFFDLRLVAPYDVAFREAVSAVGASELLRTARIFESVDEATADCTIVVGVTGLGHRQPQHPLHRLERAGRAIIRYIEDTNVALLFGSEKFGLSNSDLSYCHWLLHIPTRPEHESMNLAQAVAVCLYELVRRPAATRQTRALQKRATGDEVERLAALLREVLETAGHTDYAVTKSAEERTRRLVRRLEMSSPDASIWTGMVRQILWALRHPGGGSSRP